MTRRGVTDVSTLPDSPKRNAARAGSPAMGTAHWQARRLTIQAAWQARSTRHCPAMGNCPAALAPVLLTGGYLVTGTLQPASYNPVRTTIGVIAGQAGTNR